MLKIFLMEGARLINKLLIFCTKSRNMTVVLRNLVFAANAKRPEQRGILSVRKGDPVLLYDIDRRALIGPFIAASDVHYSSRGSWAGRWDFLVDLEPASIKIGVLSGKELLDLVLGKGTLSIRDISALDTYWVHTLVLNEADDILKGFTTAATYIRRDELAKAYGIPAIRSARIEGEPVTAIIEKELRSGGKVSEWVIEAAVSLDTDFMRELVGFPGELVVANGIYLYMRRYLDVSAFSPGRDYATIVEVKAHRDSSEIVGTVEQVSYYAYSVSRGLGIPIEGVTPAIVHYGRLQTSSSLANRLHDAVSKAEETYGIRTDKFTVLQVRNVTVKDGDVTIDYDLIY